MDDKLTGLYSQCLKYTLVGTFSYYRTSTVKAEIGLRIALCYRKFGRMGHFATFGWVMRPGLTMGCRRIL